MKRIEEVKGFHVVAWVLVIAFAAFTINLALELNNFTENILPAYSLVGPVQ